MLALTRRDGEALILQTTDGEVRILFRLDRTQIRLRIEAPDAVCIVRDELLDRPPESKPTR